MNTHKTLAVLLTAVSSLMLFSCGEPASLSAAAQAELADFDMTYTDKTAATVIKEMGNGTNLGNTMEAVWSSDLDGGMPKTSLRMMQGLKKAGFDSVRIPVAWSKGMQTESGSDYKIYTYFMNRVKEVVSYALSADLYVVLNVHWDNGWWKGFADSDMAVRKETMRRYERLWTQITQEFALWPEKLILEGANEELGEFSCKGGSLTDDERYEVANEINQKFVDIVRSSGGNNTGRVLLIAGYNTDITKTCDEGKARFKMPSDIHGADDARLMISVHYYTPWDYCGINDPENPPEWAKNLDFWGSEEDIALMRRLFTMMKTNFSDKGYPVIIGEYEVIHWKNGSLKDGTMDFLGTVVSLSKELGFCSMLWDCNSWYNRTGLRWNFDGLSAIYSRKQFVKNSYKK